MGIKGFYTIDWVEYTNFFSSWRTPRRRARIAIDMLSFAIGKDAVNCETLLGRLSRALAIVATTFVIEHVALFLDGNQTHTLKNAEHKNRAKYRNEQISKQLRYVKRGEWKDYVINGIRRQLQLKPGDVTLYQDNGEADMQIFQQFDKWGVYTKDVDNIIISSDSDVYFMAHLYRKITWFIRRQPGKDYRMYNVDSTDVVKTKMMKYTVLNKTDFYPLLYGGRYTDTDPAAVWKLDVDNIPSIARTVLDFVKMVLVKKNTKRPVLNESDVDAVVATFVRRIWFLLTALQYSPEIDEDKVLESECDKRQVIAVLMNLDIEDISTRIASIFKQQQNELTTNSIPATTGGV